MATAQLIDQAKQEAFVNKVLGDASATMTTILASIGDRLGLFKDLAANGPATSAEVASRTGTNERYVREWLGGMAAAGYVEYDPTTSRFTLPAEHVAAIATEGGPFFFGGIHQMLPALVAVVDQVTEAFHKGGGVRQANYPSGMCGLERFTAGWFNNLLLQQWIPAMPKVESKLKHGVPVSDIDCGRGRALKSSSRRLFRIATILVLTFTDRPWRKRRPGPKRLAFMTALHSSRLTSPRGFRAPMM